MIQANELRVGNWVCNCGFINIRISTIAGDSYNQFSSIPLTPEILEKSQFEFITDWTVDGNDGVVYRKDLGWLRLETGMIFCLLSG